MNNGGKLFSFEGDMSDNDKQDRRVLRTRKHLRKALMQLIDEKGYDAVTIQDITERADLGRTTFYLHYQSKDELFLDHHEGFAEMMQINTINREQLLSDEPQAEYVTFLQEISENRELFRTIVGAKDADYIMRGVAEQLQRNLENSLQQIFSTQPKIPVDILTRYTVSAQLSLIEWWMTQRNDYTPYQICEMLHRLQRAAICDAYGVKYDNM